MNNETAWKWATEVEAALARAVEIRAKAAEIRAKAAEEVRRGSESRGWSIMAREAANARVAEVIAKEVDARPPWGRAVKMESSDEY